MKKIIFTLSILLIIINAYTQDSTRTVYEEWKSSQDDYVNFDIAKYYTPNIVRNQLPFYINLNSNYSQSIGKNTWSNMDNGIVNNSYVYKNYNFIGNIASNFSHYVNTRKKISNLGIGLSLNENFSSQKNDQSFNDISSYYESNTSSEYDNVVSANHLGMYWVNKWYFSKLFYLNYQINGSVDYNFTQNKTKNQSQAIDANQKQKEFVFNFSPRLGVGYGRLEDVEDARQAIYIANALSKRNVLTRKLSNEELFELSQKISTVKNKRFLDSRLHLTNEISTVDSFFVEKNLLSNTGAAYFTTLYDMWQYGDLFPRKSGYEVYFLAFPYYTYDYVKNIPELQNGAINNPHQAFFEADLAFYYEKPVKLNWQHSVSVGVYANFKQGKIGETDFNSIFSTYGKIFSAWTSYSLGYYPNTRTNIQASVGQQIWKQISYISRDNSTQYNPGLNVNINYYLSPYLSVAGNFSLNYEHYFNKNIPEYSRNNNFNTIFNVQLVYSIF
ncbi:MAG: hypothetical protein FWD66_09945 [Paludibacter sp.]|nr:hypothetical protein [Paludibacter sp.]